MCDAVVVPKRSEKLSFTSNVLAAVLKNTSANPVPGEAFGGLSLGPSRVAEYSITAARSSPPADSISNDINSFIRRIGPEALKSVGLRL